MDPHDIDFSVTEEETVECVAGRLIAASYLPSISGGKATWILETNSAPLAVIAQQWPQPRFLVEPGRRIGADVGSGDLYFRYWCQVDPDLVYECLRDGKALPDMFGR